MIRECPNCDGNGYTVEMIHKLASYRGSDSEESDQVQIKCDRCYGMGSIEVYDWIYDDPLDDM
jgi:RecJ-like exonuclease